MSNGQKEKIEIVKQDIWLLSNDLKKHNRGFMSKVPDDSVVAVLIELRELNIKHGYPIDGKDAEKNPLFVKRTRDIIKFIKNDRFLVFYNEDENKKKQY